MKNYQKKYLFPLIAGSILRILWAVYKGIPFTSDSAVFGLMAKHILTGKEYPVFFYGQSYLGAATSYILALLMKFTADDPMLPLIVYGVSCSIILYILLVLLAKNVFGNETAWWVSLVIMIPPYYLSIWLMGVYGYCLYLFAGIFYLWMILKWVKNDCLLMNRRLMLNGVIAGIGWYIHPMFCYFIALFFLLMIIWFIKHKKLFVEFVEKILLWFLFFLPGSFLYWLGFIKHFREYNPIKTFELDCFIFFKGFLYALQQKIPILFSINKGFLPLQVIVLCLYIGILFFILNSIYIILKDKKVTPKDVIILFTSIVIIIFSFEQPYYSTENTRHITVLVIVSPLLITFFMDKFFKGKIYLKYLLVLIIFLHNVTSIFCYENTTGKLPELISYLKTNNLNKGFADYWISYYADYITDEKIVIAPFYDVDRYSEYSMNIISSENKFYLFDLNNDKQKIKYDKFQRCLKKANLVYKEDIVGDYRIFHSLYNKDGIRINFITPLFEEYFNKEDIQKDRLWQGASFLRALPSGSYKINIGVSAEFTNMMPVNQKTAGLIINRIGNSNPLAIIEFFNEDFRNKNFIVKYVNFFINNPQKDKLYFNVLFFRKISFVEYVVLQDYKPVE